jgi:hypothetical protein
MIEINKILDPRNSNKFCLQFGNKKSTSLNQMRMIHEVNKPIKINTIANHKLERKKDIIALYQLGFSHRSILPLPN